MARRVPAGCGAPSKYGTKGCIPEPVNKVVGSFSGTKGADGSIVCPRTLKNSKYFARTSLGCIQQRIQQFFVKEKALALLLRLDEWALAVDSVKNCLHLLRQLPCTTNLATGGNNILFARANEHAGTLRSPSHPVLI